MNKYILLILCMIFLLTGCGQKETLIEGDGVIKAPDQVSTISVSPHVKEISLTKEELLGMPLQNFQEFVINTFPNYREYYKIGNEEMTDEDWEILRRIICVEYFGDDSVIEEAVETPDPNWIYTSPTIEYIESLTLEEFREYLSGMQEFWYPDSEKLNFDDLTNEQLLQVKNEYIEGLE